MNTIGKDIVYGDVFSVKRIKCRGDPWDLGIDTIQEKDGAEKILDGNWKQKTENLPSKDDDFITKGYPKHHGEIRNIII
jgi:hypothetical protein